MDKQGHRFRIWDLAHNRPEPKDTPADPRPGRSGRKDLLLYNDLGASPVDESATLASLYDHRLPVDVELPGRCLMPGGRSAQCKAKKISSESVDLVYEPMIGYPARAPVELPMGSTVHLDLEHIGNFHGVVTAQNSEGFQLAVDVECKGLLIAKLGQVAAAIRNTHFEDAPVTARRAIIRIEPEIKQCSYTDHQGQTRRGKIINVSPYDALIKAAIIPIVGTHIVFGGKQPRVAEVTRTFEIGFAVQFCAPIPEEDFSPSIRFVDE